MTSTLWLRPLAFARLTFAGLTLACTATSIRLILAILWYHVDIVYQARRPERCGAEHDQ